MSRKLGLCNLLPLDTDTDTEEDRNSSASMTASQPLLNHPGFIRQLQLILKYLPNLVLLPHRHSIFQRISSLPSHPFLPSSSRTFSITSSIQSNPRLCDSPS